MPQIKLANKNDQFSIGNTSTGILTTVNGRVVTIDAIDTNNLSNTLKNRLSTSDINISTLQSTLSSEITNRGTNNTTLSTALSGEITIRSSDNTSLSTGLTSEITYRISADTSIVNYINTTFSDLKGSAPELLDTLQELAEALSGDVNFAGTVINKIVSVESNLSTASNSRISGDTSLSTAIANEVNSRISGDTSLSSALSTALTTLATGDTSLSTAIANEVNSRISGDTSLITKLSTVLSTEVIYIDSKFSQNVAGVYIVNNIGVAQNIMLPIHYSCPNLLDITSQSFDPGNPGDDSDFNIPVNDGAYDGQSSVGRYHIIGCDNRDNYWLVYPKYGLIVYSGISYNVGGGDILINYRNRHAHPVVVRAYTTGSISTTGEIQRASSVQIYYDGAQQTKPTGSGPVRPNVLLS